MPTLISSGYTVANNRPLDRARILWDPIVGTVTADGTNGNLATNDFTNQRWSLAAGVNLWTLQTASNVSLDCVFIAAHNLAGKTVKLYTSNDTVSAMVLRATFVPADNEAICILLNNAGAAYVIRRFRIEVDDGTNVKVGIIRGGVALQMQEAVHGGLKPIHLNRVTENQHRRSENGQWLGNIEKLKYYKTSITWEHLFRDWYETNFEPFSLVLPNRPFGLVVNAVTMPKAVAWCWTNQNPEPENMGGGTPWLTVSLDITGFAG